MTTPEIFFRVSRNTERSPRSISNLASYFFILTTSSHESFDDEILIEFLGTAIVGDRITSIDVDQEKACRDISGSLSLDPDKVDSVPDRLSDEHWDVAFSPVPFVPHV